MSGHESELLGDGREGLCEWPAGEGRGRVGEGAFEGGELGFEEDQARVWGRGKGPHQGDGVAGGEDVDVLGRVHVGVDVDDLGGVCHFGWCWNGGVGWWLKQ